MNTQMGTQHYEKKTYGTLSRFIAYYYQIRFIRESGAKRVLIIGSGDNVVPSYLRRFLEVTTLDIDPDLHPDVVGDLRQLPFPDNSFDAVCAFEVLEHMPLEESKRGLAEMARVSRKDALISVPHRRTGFELIFRFPFIQTFFRRDWVRLALRVPVRFPEGVSKQHHWEIDGRSTKLKSWRTALREHFEITHEETPLLSMYIRFFILRKK